MGSQLSSRLKGTRHRMENCSLPLPPLPQDALEGHLACEAWWNKGLFSSNNWEYFCMYYNTCAALIIKLIIKAEFEKQKNRISEGSVNASLHTSYEKTSNTRLLFKFCIISLTILNPSFSWHLKSLHIFDNYIKDYMYILDHYTTVCLTLYLHISTSQKHATWKVINNHTTYNLYPHKRTLSCTCGTSGPLRAEVCTSFHTTEWGAAELPVQVWKPLAVMTTQRPNNNSMNFLILSEWSCCHLKS